MEEPADDGPRVDAAAQAQVAFEPPGDVGDRPLALDGHEQPPRGVPLQQRRGLRPVDAQPVPHGRFAVVHALIQLASAGVTDALPAWRIRDHVEAVPAATTHPAPREPADELRLGDVEVDDALQRLADVLEQALQALGLRNRARETVQQ